MPALKNGEHNLYNGRVVDKESEDVVYFDDTHEYIDKESGNKGISVTTLIHNYTNPFDADFWASYKALESLMDMDTWLILKKTLLSRKKFDSRYLTKFNIDEEEFLTKKAEILKSYDTTREESCKRGTEMHSILEQALYRKDPSISKYQFGGNLDVYEGNYSKELKDGVYPEYLVSYKFNDLIICGQIDLLIIENKEVTIIDHKGLPIDTEILTTTGFKQMKDLKVGDVVFDKDGKPTKITVKSDIHYNPCYKIVFDTGEEIVCDHEHR